MSSPSSCWFELTAVASVSVCHSNSVLRALPTPALVRNGVSHGATLEITFDNCSRTPMASKRVNVLVTIAIVGYFRVARRYRYSGPADDDAASGESPPT